MGRTSQCPSWCAALMLQNVAATSSEMFLMPIPHAGSCQAPTSPGDRSQSCRCGMVSRKRFYVYGELERVINGSGYPGRRDACRWSPCLSPDTAYRVSCKTINPAPRSSSPAQPCVSKSAQPKTPATRLTRRPSRCARR